MQFQLGDHLGSSNVVVDSGGAVVNREEFTPYGETSFGSFVKKRYRFTGKERDEESGLTYHGARYDAPWLARWVSYDPIGIVAGTNVYTYCDDSPVQYRDPSGLDLKGTGEWSTSLVVDTEEPHEAFAMAVINGLVDDFSSKEEFEEST